jgi:hypothetical protein
VVHAQRDLPDGSTAQQGIIVDEATGNKLSINADGSINSGIKETPPTDPTKNNSSIALSYDGSGNLQYIDETIGVDVYRTTFTFTGGKITGVSSTVKL